MDILKQELQKKRQSLSEDTGGRKVFKRSEIEQKRRRVEEKRDAEAKTNQSDPNSSSNPIDSTKSISDEQKLNLPKQEDLLARR
ncbi:hypothetical protein L1987_35708 [Smallanthus sonchifolius]|uniref:Uncharacterized protein n=1 Tax=Smallanthus sonchifolius TaxID=185202 RepID=A0ACB9HBH3_9ASTR|nr:hypothetical protein L1987_35708 [Smallanthus sonchifolius]